MRRPSKRVTIWIAGVVGVILVGGGVLAIRSYAFRPLPGAALSHRPSAGATQTPIETPVTEPGGSPSPTPTASSSPSSNASAVAAGHSIPNVLGAGVAQAGYDAGSGYPLLVTTDMQAGGLATWQWDGVGWVRLRREQSPPFLPQSSLAYDPQLGQTVVLYGNGMLAWNGSRWSDLHVTSPSNCGGQYYLALDAHRKLLVLLCADSPTSTTTWLFDGTRWFHAPAVTGPPPRTAAGFAYDGQNTTIVLFGGRDMLGKTDADTWVWDGLSWTEHHPPVSPPGGTSLLAYDSTKGEMVLLQQPESLGPNSVDSEWIWDGSTWTNRGTAPPPGPYASLIDDPAHHYLLLFEGFSDQEPGSQTWRRLTGVWSRAS